MWSEKLRVLYKNKRKNRTNLPRSKGGVTIFYRVRHGRNLRIDILPNSPLESGKVMVRVIKQ